MAALKVVMYHYVRDLQRSPFPRLKAMPFDEFRRQVRQLRAAHEMATLESCLAFLRGEYLPARDLCLLTFDDGLRDHFENAMPVLREERIQGVFFVISSCMDNGHVAPVHMNHFLMAALDFKEYSESVLDGLGSYASEARQVMSETGQEAERTYPWDTADVARFKYFFNFRLEPQLRDEAVARLFRRRIGPPEQFARQLYLTWEEACAMQAAGMVIGGHTHSHQPLAAMPPEACDADLAQCRELLDRKLARQSSYPFSYPYGKRSSFTHGAVAKLQALGFDCAVSTEAGLNAPGTDLFCIRRIDCKNALS
jgi:peptidoglycan/xylan/chitin deacetylase (PgdA/CDA1 family)